MTQKPSHAAVVDVWIERLGSEVPSRRLLEELVPAFNTLWRRAHRTLGELMLMAIGNRILHAAAECYPFLRSLELDPDGIQLRETFPHDVNDMSDVNDDTAHAAVCYVLTEFLTVLGRLTAEIFTPALHAELMKIGDGGADERPPDSSSDQSMGGAS